MKLAREADLDLVKIAPNAKPPVCKIVDYGKYRYELARREKEAKKKQRTMEVKEIRLSPNIDVNDLNTKANQARKFLSKGDRVKVSLRFRGRELAHINYSKQILDSFYEKLEDIAVVDKPAKMEGRTMVMFLSEKRQYRLADRLFGEQGFQGGVLPMQIRQIINIMQIRRKLSCQK